MSAPDPKTFCDYIDTLAYHLGGAQDARNQPMIRDSILTAYRDVSEKRNWTYLWQKYRVDFNAPYNTGTIQYTEATRVLTLTGGTFPSWAGNGYADVRINNVVSRVASMTDSTDLVLDPINEPIADIPAGTGYALYQTKYPMPADMRALCRPSAEILWWWSEYIDPEEWMLLDRQGIGGGTTGTPTRWTILGDPNVYGGLMIAVWPYPNLAKTYDFMYQRYPRPLKRTGVPAADCAGTVAGTATMNTLTGTSTQFIQAHVGSVIRLSGTTKPPNGISGVNPYLEQAVVQSVQSGTGLTLATPLQNTYTAAGYVISDPIDFPQHILTAFERGLELEIAHKKDRGSLPKAEESYRRALILAFESDLRFLSPRAMDAGLVPVRPTLKYMQYTPPSSP